MGEASADCEQEGVPWVPQHKIPWISYRILYPRHTPKGGRHLIVPGQARDKENGHISMRPLRRCHQGRDLVESSKGGEGRSSKVGSLGPGCS